MSGFPRFALPQDSCNLPLARCRSRQDQAEKRILIQHCGASGDVLMATPVLTALRRAYPEAHLTWIVAQTEAGTLDAHPCIDELLLWDSDYWKGLLRSANYPRYLLDARKLARHLQERRYDIFISYQPEEWAYLVTRACGAAVRIGVFDTGRDFDGATKTSGNTRHFTRSYVYGNHPPHRTNQYLLPLEALGLAPADRQMMVGYTQIDRASAERWLKENGVQPARFVVIAPLTAPISRRWESGKFAALADALRGDGYSVVFLGSADQKWEMEGIADLSKRGVLTAVGTFTFRERAALLAQSALVVSGDDEHMHLASAVGAPFVALFGPTPPARFAPLTGNGRALYRSLPCSPCFQATCPLIGDEQNRCLRSLSVEECLEAARAVLAGGDSRPGAVR